MTLDNVAVTEGLVYNISAYRGFLVVAYPNKNVETEFAFDYWVEALYLPAPKPELPPAEWYDFEGEAGESIFSTLVFSSISLSTILTVLCIVWCVLFVKNKKK